MFNIAKTLIEGLKFGLSNNSEVELRRSRARKNSQHRVIIMHAEILRSRLAGPVSQQLFFVINLLSQGQYNFTHSSELDFARFIYFSSALLIFSITIMLLYVIIT